MTSGRKLLKIGWYMLAVPFILIFGLVATYTVVSDGPYRANVLLNIIVAVLAAIMVLSIVPIAAGTATIIAKKIAGRRKRSSGAER